jgi:hypothetical protein
MNISLAEIQDFLEKHFGAVSIERAQTIHELFQDHRDFWFDDETDRRLRLALCVEIRHLTGQDGEISAGLAEALIRNVSGLPEVEDDTDPIYPYYRERAGEVLLIEDEMAVRIVGPCTASPFRWAVVESLSDNQRWTISWFVLTKLRVLDQAETDALTKQVSPGAITCIEELNREAS